MMQLINLDNFPKQAKWTFTGAVNENLEPFFFCSNCNYQIRSKTPWNFTECPKCKSLMKCSEKTLNGIW